MLSLESQRVFFFKICFYFASLFCFVFLLCLGNSEFCFPRMSMFPETSSSLETKFTVPLGTSH